jgi:hypothetical protein
MSEALDQHPALAKKGSGREASFGNFGSSMRW